MPPKIERKQLADITVSAGEMLKFEGNVIGEPPADVTWEKEGDTIDSKEDKSLTITNVPYNTKLIIRSCRRRDQGTYNVFAKNSVGSDQVTVKLNVLDKPSPPENLKASDIHATGCTLKWRRPKDDGGCPIEYYQVEKLDPDTGLWIPCGRSTDTMLDVKGLTEGKTYKFRVTAINEEGESLPCVGDEDVTARGLPVPSAPMNLTLVDYDRDSVDLKWEAPLDNGGSEITGYLVEKKDSSGRWERAHEVPGGQLKCTVPNLVEFETYEFRIKAINAGGMSEPSNEVGPVTCKARNQPPRIDRTGLMEVRCKAGESFNFDVNISGDPEPRKSWVSNENELESSERIKIVFQEYNTKIFVRSASRKESGILTIRAENKHGSDSVDIDIIVIDVPGAPMGPLNVKEMTANDCWLEWKPPKDNGGMPITYYVVEKLDETVGGRWSFAGETDGPITTYNVQNLTENHRYKFRVRAVNKEGKSEPLETSGAYLACNPFDPPSKPGKPAVIDFDSEWAKLEWDVPEYDGGSKITHYIIEKRDKMNQKWEVCGKTEGPEPVGTVKHLIEGNFYEFRVKAVNKAGESEPSDPSLPHKARPKNLAPKIDRHAMYDIKILAGEPLNINVPVDGEPPPTKQWEKDGQKIVDGLRLTIHNEDYMVKIRVTESKRIDTGVYKLTANNINGTDTATCNVTVLDVPAPPEGPVVCKNIHKEWLEINWKIPLDDGGSDIKSYIVEKQDQSNMRWIPSGETRSLTMKVEGLIEEHEYKFRIRAVNAQGEGGPLIGPTPPVIAGDPFRVPSKPGKPFATNWSPDTIDLEWEPPRTDGGSTITKWIIEKKTKFGIWEFGAECSGPAPVGSVTGLTEGTEYEFRIIAVNEAGNSEPSDPSDPITAEARYVHPFIDTSALQDMVVCAGQTISYNVPILGSPKPLVKWSIKNVVVTSNEHIDIMTSRRNTTLDIQYSERSDAGTYILEVTNELGSALARANVKVLDRPAPPERPLVLSGVTSSSCNLKWGPSPDDGGSPITHYLVEKMDVSRGSWMEANITTDLKTTITGLIHKKEYFMRVKAVNAIGESDPLPLDKSFIAKNESDVPDPPGKPSAYDWDSDHIDLEWAKPLHDGGSTILGYIIQKKEKGTTIWCDSTTVETNTSRGTASKLLEGSYYQFRIIAFNDAGNSVPGEPSGFIQARPRYQAPKIITPLKDVSVKAGNNFTIDVEYIGSPDPNVNWYNEGTPLVTDERATVSAIAPITTFHIVNCKRTDSGDLTIKLVNESGSDKGNFYFNVLDVPGTPTGPIVYEEVTGNSVTISWKKPLDNGGSDITGYVIEKKDLDHAGGWVPAVSHVDPYTLTHKVPRLVEGTSYELRVFAVNAQGRSIPLPTDEPITPRTQFDIPGKPSRPFATDADFTFIKVAWKPPTNNGGSKITGYDVERRDLLGGRWIRVSTRIVTTTEYYDSDVTENHQYEYKVRAHNEAGPGPHSDPSIPITARPMKSAPKLDLDALNRRVRVRAGENIHVKIPYVGSPMPTCSWSKEGKIVHTNRFASHVRPEDIVFDLDDCNRLDSGKYKVVAENEHGSDSGYLTVTVLDRPDLPIGPVMYQNIDRDVIKLMWNPPEDDGGSEVTGYIIEKTEYGSSDWIACPGYATSCEYLARGLTEGKKYIFRIRAENVIGVSDALVGKHVEARSPYDPPGPPGQPEVTAYSPSTASLVWKPPTETGGIPITGYYIEKREIGQEWNRVNFYPCTGLTYVVPGLREGARYEFRIIACNEAGPGQPSRPSEPITAGVQKFKPGPPEGVNPDRITKSSVTLSWRPPRNDGGCKIEGYIIEVKGRDDADWREVNSFQHPEIFYNVKNLIEKAEYSFRVSAVNEIGRGEPSRATQYVKIGEQPNQPKIDLSCVKDIRVVAGEDFSVNINYTAWPKPTAQFWNEDVELGADSRVHIQVTEEFVSIIVKSSVRSDAGQYRLRLTNDAGYDTAMFNVVVLDRPGPPRNIEGTDFAGESLTLNWMAPKDNGGSPITNYIVEKGEKGTWTKVSSYITSCYTRIRNLVVNTDYDFRIYAENHYGVSDPATTSEPITARHPFDPPGAPGQPRDMGSTSDSISIEWGRPRQDGGSPIIGYVIEKRKVGGGWSKACHSTVSDITYRVIGLEENCEYEFKVAAVNAAGQGPWSMPSDPIRCVPARCAPKITSDLSLRDMTIIAGHEISITVPFLAVPQPKARWSANGVELSPDERMRMEISEHQAHFYNKRAKRSDTGTYNIQLTNSEGSDQASCKVLVVDRPGPPSQPIDAYDITPETCTLSWRPPIDDGGSSITNYVVDKLDVAGGYWNKICSFVRGLHYDVMGLEPNKKYKFRIKAENQYGVSDPCEMEDAITAKFPFSVPDPPGKPKVTQETTTSVNLTWDRPYSDGGSKIQGYKVEYREVIEEHWVVSTTSLIRSQTYTVTGLVTGSEYEFRVKAVNAAGESRPSPPSTAFKLKGSAHPPGPPGTPTVTKIGKDYVDLKWTPPSYDGGAKISGYVVEKRDTGSPLWTRVNDYNVLDLEYTVISLTENHDYEFRVSAVNSAGRGDPSQSTPSVRVCEVSDGKLPEFIKPLHNVGAGLGRKVVLTCEATGKPIPKSKWMKNGRELSEQPGRVIMEEKNGTFILTIEELWEIDDGDYICQAFNSLGYVNTNCRLRVGAPPRIEYIPSELHLPEGDNSKVKIKWSGDMPFTVELFKEGQLMTESTNFKMAVFDEFLILFMRDITKEAFAGRWTVKVSNDSGSTEESFMVYISGLPGPPVGPLDVSEITSHTCQLNWHLPKFDGGSKITHYVVERRDITHQHWIVIASFCKLTTFAVQGLTEGQEYLFRILAANANGTGPPLDGVNPIKAKSPYDLPDAPSAPKVTGVGGDFVNLLWEKPEEDGGSRIKGYWIEKREQGMELWQRVNQFIQAATQINISNLIEGRSYEFRIFAENEAGCSKASDLSALVCVKDPDEPQAPEIIQPLKGVSCTEEKNATFVCRVTGYPRPKVTWYKGARELFDSAKHEIITSLSSNTYELVVKGVFGEDEDSYTCRAVNTGGTKSTKADLTIKTPPRLKVPPRFRDSAFFDKGENGVIKIPFTGNPKPRVSWTRDGENIETGGHFQVKTEDRHALLTIMDVSKTDSGPYTITIDNELGSDFALINVQISDRPDPPRWPATSQIGTDSLVLEWQQPQWDGGSAITNFIVEKQELPMTSWTRVGHTRFNLMPVTDLAPGGEYRFRVFAENVYGRSDASDESSSCQTKGLMKKKQPKTKYDGKENSNV